MNKSDKNKQTRGKIKKHYRKSSDGDPIVPCITRIDIGYQKNHANHEFPLKKDMLLNKTTLKEQTQAFFLNTVVQRL